jgi:hypothetical protein
MRGAPVPDLPLLLGAAIFAFGMLAGRFWPARRKGRKPVKSAVPACGCKHDLSFHDPQTGQCHSPMYVPGTSSRSSHHEPCTCRQYNGPQPLPEYFAPEIGR